jgi:uncharacterized protein (DUF1810 family)
VPSADDPFDLARFVAAQDEDGTYGRALGEVEQGRKLTHWMWFVYPQLAGLGRTERSRFYAISGLDEARAYLAHPVLGARLRACARAATAVKGRSAEQVFGSTDASKLRSSMTLFRAVDPAEPVFTAVLDRYFDGEPDPVTLRLLGGSAASG